MGDVLLLFTSLAILRVPRRHMIDQKWMARHRGNVGPAKFHSVELFHDAQERGVADGARRPLASVPGCEDYAERQSVHELRGW